MDSSIKFLKSLKRPVYLVYGNNDYLNKEAKKYNLRGVEDRIKKSNIKLIKTGILKLGEYKVVGYSGLNSDKQKLYKIYLKAKKPVIFLTHVPARGYHDKVLLKESPMKGMHVGDQNYLKAIKKYKPLIHVSSHMHEHQGKKKLEKTMVVNSGAAFLGRYAIVELENNKVKVVKLVK